MRILLSRTIPTTGSWGTPNDETMRVIATNDPTNRVWVRVTEWVRPYTDHTEDYFGPIIEDRKGDYIVIEVHGESMTFPYSRVTVHRG